MLIENSTNDFFFISKNDNSCGDRASERVSDKFICINEGQTLWRLSLIKRKENLHGKQLSQCT